MQKTKIEWCDYTINPVKGLCPMACSYCYARRMYKRFHWNPEVRYEDPFYDYYALKGKPPARVFIGSTMELFGPWVRGEWLHNGVFSYIRTYTEHTFILLTKQPQNLATFSPFPKNCWVGVSATDRAKWLEAVQEFQDVQATVKFISFEPLLDWSYSDREPQSHVDYTADWFRRSGINWVIIGRQTPPSRKTTPKVEWIRQIVEAADKAGAKVFLKNNLKELPLEVPMFFDLKLPPVLRQEFPSV